MAKLSVPHHRRRLLIAIALLACLGGASARATDEANLQSLSCELMVLHTTDDPEITRESAHVVAQAIHDYWKPRYRWYEHLLQPVFALVFRKSLYVDLEADHCSGACWALQEQLSREAGMRMEARLTQEQIGRPLRGIDSTRMRHYFLVLRDDRYPGLDRQLVVDPTIRQWFEPFLTREELDRVPLVFVGSWPALRDLFYEHLSEPMLRHLARVGEPVQGGKDWVNENWVRHWVSPYLSAQPADQALRQQIEP